MITRLISLIVLVFLALPLCATGEAVFETTISANEIALDESITLTFYVRSNSIGRLRFPAETEDFIVAAQSTSTSIKIVNGERSQQHRITLMLTPKHLGKFTIPSGSIDAQGFTHSSDPVTVNVIAARNPTASKPGPVVAPTASVAPATTRTAEANSSYPVFAKLSVSNPNPFIGEQIKLKLRIYHQGNLRNIDFSSAAFSFDNFLQEKIEPGVEGEEIIDGQKYFYYETASILFPVKAGQAVIPAQKLTVKFLNVQAMQARAFDPFAQLVTRSFEESKVITAPSMVVTVRALPKPAPKNFSGYSGTLNLSHQLDKTSVEEGSAVSLITSASGTGNPKSLTLDLVAKSNQYTLFDDKKNINSSVSGGIKSFSLTTRKAIIPKRSGKLVIDVAPLVYFNSRTQLYETIPGRKLELEVLPSSGEPSKEPDALRADDQPAKKEIMMLSAHQVSSKRTPILLPLWLMLLIISVLNLGYLVFSLRDQLARLSELELSDGMNLTKAIKLVKVADSVEKVSVLVKEFAAYAKAEQAEKINKFMAVTDMLLYSGEAESSAKLEEIRASAITILEEIKRHAK